eukprot:870497-Rhodomonas_salina.2
MSSAAKSNCAIWLRHACYRATPLLHQARYWLCHRATPPLQHVRYWLCHRATPLLRRARSQLTCSDADLDDPPRTQLQGLEEGRQRRRRRRQRSGGQGQEGG